MAMYRMQPPCYRTYLSAITHWFKNTQRILLASEIALSSTRLTSVSRHGVPQDGLQSLQQAHRAVCCLILRATAFPTKLHPQQCSR